MTGGPRNLNPALHVAVQLPPGAVTFVEHEAGVRLPFRRGRRIGQGRADGKKRSIKENLNLVL